MTSLIIVWAPSILKGLGMKKLQYEMRICQKSHNNVAKTVMDPNGSDLISNSSKSRVISEIAFIKNKKTNGESEKHFPDPNMLPFKAN